MLPIIRDRLSHYRVFIRRKIYFRELPHPRRTDGRTDDRLHRRTC